MNFLGYDGLPARAVRYLWELFLLNVCFVLCCLPIVTIGRSVSAMYTVFFRTDDDTRLSRRFLRAFRAERAQATKLWLLLCAAALLLGLDGYFLLTREIAFGGTALLLSIPIALAFLFGSVFLFPLHARYENTLRATVKNAVILGLTHPLRALAMLAMAALPLIALLADVMVFLHLLAVWLPWGFAFTFRVRAWIAGSVFRKISPPT